MKLNFEKTFTAPFSTKGDTSITNIYLIAAALTLGGFIIMMIFQMFSQLFMGGLQAVMASGSTFNIIIGVILILIITIITMLANMCLLGMPLGYVVETVKLEIYDRSSIMPSWTGNYGRFFWNGFKMQLIMVIYGLILMLIIIVPAIIFGIIVGVTSGHNEDMAALAGGVGGMIFFVLMFILIFGYIIILPMILVHYAAEGKFLAGFSIFKIIGKIFSNLIDYIVALVVIIGLGIMGSVLYMVLCITCVGILAIPVVAYFLLPIMMLNLIAQVYKD